MSVPFVHRRPPPEHPYWQPTFDCYQDEAGETTSWGETIWHYCVGCGENIVPPDGPDYCEECMVPPFKRRKKKPPVELPEPFWGW